MYLNSYFISLKMDTWLVETCVSSLCIYKLNVIYLCASVGTIVVSVGKSFMPLTVGV